MLRWWSPAMHSDLWYDEVFSYNTASLPFFQMFHKLLLGGDTNPPLYTMVLHFWLKFGHSPTHIKLLSLLFGLAAIGLAFYLGKMIGGIKLASIAAFLFAVSGSVIRYSVEARPYSLFMFFSLLSTIFFLRACEQPAEADSRRFGLNLWGGYVVATVLAI